VLQALHAEALVELFYQARPSQGLVKSLAKAWAASSIET